MNNPQITWLPDNRRLHLHHGPIDMIVGVTGPGRRAAMHRAARRFDTLLDELVSEMPLIRVENAPIPSTETARHMADAVAPFRDRFITPMAAVAGAGAQTILRAICAGPGVDKAYVNNGGDVAFALSPGQTMTAAIAGTPGTTALIRHTDRARGIATSGWRGRSHSLGIADSVTVLAKTAAQADAAATIIANHIDLPAHPGILRQPANTLAPDSDLGARRITTYVPQLHPSDIARALKRGAVYAQTCLRRGLIEAAFLTLQSTTETIATTPCHIQQELDPIDA